MEPLLRCPCGSTRFKNLTRTPERRRFARSDDLRVKGDCAVCGRALNKVVRNADARSHSWMYNT